MFHSRTTGGFRWSLDEPSNILSISADDADNVDRPGLALPIDSLRAFVSALRVLSRADVAFLAAGLNTAAAEWADDESSSLPPALHAAAGLLLAFLLASPAALPEKGAALRDAALALASVLPCQSPGDAWRARFQRRLPPLYRAEVLAIAEACDQRMPMRELVWWTAQCRLDHAIEWCDGETDVAAANELAHAAAAYIELLRHEPARRVMESFYALQKTTSEREVVRAFREREKLAGDDDLLRADIVSWLLRRYSVVAAGRLLYKSLRITEKTAAVVSAAFILASMGMFLFQMAPRFQALLQAVAFIILVRTPRLFAMLLPRALFGTLLAWITVVLAQAASLLPIVSEGSGASVRTACHLWLKAVAQPGSAIPHWMSVFGPRHWIAPPPVVDFIGLTFGCLLVSVLFLSVEVSGRLAARMGKSALNCVLIMFGGSLFWGAMLVPALRYIVAREATENPCHCIFPAWLLGSACAVVFGILVQLLWDDHAVSDSIGSPSSPATV